MEESPKKKARMNKPWDMFEYNEPIRDFIHRTCSKEKILTLYAYTNSCYCCKRHCQYKPNLLGGEPNHNPKHPSYTYDKKCDCNCRHMSRHLYEAYYMK
jgi:hypothetical protein